MGAKEMPGSGRILSSFSFFFFLVVRPLAVNGYVFPFSFVFPIHSIHPWPSLSVFFSFLGQVVDDRMVETSTSQILPTVTNDFLFHFLKVTVGKVKVWLVERERQAGIGLLLAMNRFQANLLYYRHMRKRLTPRTYPWPGRPSLSFGLFFSIHRPTRDKI